jgi:hypothetical protein
MNSTRILGTTLCTFNKSKFNFSTAYKLNLEHYYKTKNNIITKETFDSVEKYTQIIYEREVITDDPVHNFIANETNVIINRNECLQWTTSNKKEICFKEIGESNQRNDSLVIKTKNESSVVCHKVRLYFNKNDINDASNNIITKINNDVLNEAITRAKIFNSDIVQEKCKLMGIYNPIMNGNINFGIHPRDGITNFSIEIDNTARYDLDQKEPFNIEKFWNEKTSKSVFRRKFYFLGYKNEKTFVYKSVSTDSDLLLNQLYSNLVLDN